MLIGPKYKICKRLGGGVFEKCQTQKFSLSEARRGKKIAGKKRRALSDYGRQLLEMQRVRFTYGLPERELYRYVRESRSGVRGDLLGPLFLRLELRLDSVVYRLGFATTRRLARQLVSHGHILVNGRRSTTPSELLSVGDTVAVREGSKVRPLFAALPERLKEHTLSPWLSRDDAALSGKILTAPDRASLESSLNLGAVVEFYSR